MLWYMQLFSACFVMILNINFVSFKFIVAVVPSLLYFLYSILQHTFLIGRLLAIASVCFQADYESCKRSVSRTTLKYLSSSFQHVHFILHVTKMLTYTFLSSSPIPHPPLLIHLSSSKIHSFTSKLFISLHFLTSFTRYMCRTSMTTLKIT